MPRRKRYATGGHVFHVLNRAVGRQTIFETDHDYEAFLKVLEDARQYVPMRLLAYCIMPNHWHLVLWPHGDDDLSQYMYWLTMTHTQRWHAFHQTIGTGPLYQGRFKSFAAEQDDHFYRVCRYVERNGLRANLARRAESWRWGSLWQSVNNCWPVTIDDWPLPRSPLWAEYVNGIETEDELAAIRSSVRRGSPFGSAAWTRQTATNLGIESTLRPLGRPRTE